MRTDDRARRMREGSSGRKLPAGPRYLSSRGDGEEAEMGLGCSGLGSWSVRVPACGGARVVGEATSPAPGYFCRWEMGKERQRLRIRG